MHPGLECIGCHQREGEGPRFDIAGTVYPTAHEPDDCNGTGSGITVVITDSTGRQLSLQTTAVGNFGRLLLMQADLQGAVAVGPVHADASIGFARDGAFAASLVGDDQGRLVSRIHWLGVNLDADHAWLVRAGRMNLPFGLRIIEHTMWVRQATRTDINVAQQHGVSVSYTGDRWRGELMGIAGNFQISPDAVRERGYSGMLEYAITEKAAAGVSSLVTYAARDLILETPVWRQAHGLFGRVSPVHWLVLMAEADLILTSQEVNNSLGFAAFAQADVELTQGLHVIGAVEAGSHLDTTLSPSFGPGLSGGGWLGVVLLPAHRRARRWRGAEHLRPRDHRDGRVAPRAAPLLPVRPRMSTRPSRRGTR